MKAGENLCTLLTDDEGLDDGLVVIEDIRSSDDRTNGRAKFERLGIRGFLKCPVARDADGDVLASMCAYSTTPLTQSLDATQLAAVADASELLSSIVPGSALLEQERSAQQPSPPR